MEAYSIAQPLFWSVGSGLLIGWGTADKKLPGETPMMVLLSTPMEVTTSSLELLGVIMQAVTLPATDWLPERVIWPAV